MLHNMKNQKPVPLIYEGDDLANYNYFWDTWKEGNY